MIYDKTYLAPAPSAGILRLPVSRLRDGDTVRDVTLVHMREQDGGLECGPGIAPSQYEVSVTPKGVYATDDEVFISYTVGNYYRLFAAKAQHRFGDLNLGSVKRVVSVSMDPASVEPAWYVMSNMYCVLLRLTSSSLNNSFGQSGCFILQYAHRIFVLTKGNRLIFTKPLDAEADWYFVESAELQGYGYLDIPPLCGDTLDGFVLGDKLYILCQFGLTEVTMGAKTLNGKLRHIHADFGEAMANTVFTLGDRAYFFTSQGFYSFDGNSFRRLPAPGYRRIDFSVAFRAGVSMGKYFAHVALKDGNRCIYMYDPLYERESFLDIDADDFSAGFRPFALKGGKLYELTERGLPLSGEPCRLYFKLPSGERKFASLDWICVEGEGQFTVETGSPDDGCATAKGPAGKRLPLSRAIGGREISVNISAAGEDFRITGISAGYSGEVAYDD